MAGIARQHCANFANDGSCIGVERRTDGTQVSFQPEGARCLLLEGKRCGYFEAYVMPMASESWEWKNYAATSKSESNKANDKEIVGPNAFRSRASRPMGETTRFPSAGWRRESRR
jgi:hypothetical protein